MWKAHKVDLDMFTCEVCKTFKTDAPSKLKVCVILIFTKVLGPVVQSILNSLA